LRRIAPDMPRPYRTWGYPVVPGLFLIGALALTVNLWIDRPLRSSIGLLMMLSGLFFYRHWSRTSAVTGGEGISTTR
jgi:APA family basic amino acid/polyamine antiporter